MCFRKGLDLTQTSSFSKEIQDWEILRAPYDGEATVLILKMWMMKVVFWGNETASLRPYRGVRKGCDLTFQVQGLLVSSWNNTV